MLPNASVLGRGEFVAGRLRVDLGLLLPLTYPLTYACYTRQTKLVLVLTWATRRRYS